MRLETRKAGLTKINCLKNAISGKCRITWFYNPTFKYDLFYQKSCLLNITKLILLVTILINSLNTFYEDDIHQSTKVNHVTCSPWLIAPHMTLPSLTSEWEMVRIRDFFSCRYWNKIHFVRGQYSTCYWLFGVM